MCVWIFQYTELVCLIQKLCTQGSGPNSWDPSAPGAAPVACGSLSQVHWHAASRSTHHQKEEDSVCVCVCMSVWFNMSICVGYCLCVSVYRPLGWCSISQQSICRYKSIHILNINVYNCIHFWGFCCLIVTCLTITLFLFYYRLIVLPFGTYLVSQCMLHVCLPAMFGAILLSCSVTYALL